LFFVLDSSGVEAYEGPKRKKQSGGLFLARSARRVLLLCNGRRAKRIQGVAAVDADSCHSDQKGSGINVPEPFSLFTAGQRLTAHIKESAEDLVPQRMKIIRRSEY